MWRPDFFFQFIWIILWGKSQSDSPYTYGVDGLMLRWNILCHSQFLICLLGYLISKLPLIFDHRKWCFIFHAITRVWNDYVKLVDESTNSQVSKKFTRNKINIWMVRCMQLNSHLIRKIKHCAYEDWKQPEVRKCVSYYCNEDKWPLSFTRAKWTPEWFDVCNLIHM